MVEHFRTHVKHKIGGRAKAMVVTDSRVHAVRYKLSFDKYIAEKGYTDIKTPGRKTLTSALTVPSGPNAGPRRNFAMNVPFGASAAGDGVSTATAGFPTAAGPPLSGPSDFFPPHARERTHRATGR